MLSCLWSVQLGTSNVAGTGAMSGRLLVRLTTGAPAGAWVVGVRLMVQMFPPVMLAGASENAASATVRLVSMIELFDSSGSGTLLETMAWCSMVPTPVARARTVTSRPNPSLSQGTKSHVTTVGATVHVPSL